jgi:hypothetical protein
VCNRFRIKIPSKDGFEKCEIVSLSTTDAKNFIDAKWWDLDEQGNAPDIEWEWAKIVQKHQYKGDFDRLCIKNNAGEIIGAMILYVDGLSVIDKGERAVMITWLATEPKSRHSCLNRRYTKIGKALVQLAVRISNSLGFAGKVVAGSLLESESFYLKLGFTKTDLKNNEQLNFLELSSSAASQLLADEL